MLEVQLLDELAWYCLPICMSDHESGWPMVVKQCTLLGIEAGSEWPFCFCSAIWPMSVSTFYSQSPMHICSPLSLMHGIATYPSLLHVVYP